MAHPLLVLGDFGHVVQSIGGGARSQRVYAETMHIKCNADTHRVELHNISVNRAWIEVFVQVAGSALMVFHPEIEQLLTAKPMIEPGRRC